MLKIAILLLLIAGISFADNSKTYTLWSSAHTQEYITMVKEFKPAIKRMFLSILPSEDKSVLEIGSGPLGGVLHYLGKDLVNITPTEANPESYLRLKKSYPRAIQTSAQNLSTNIKERYDTILLSNVMDCIMSGDEEDIKNAFREMKKALNPGGKILIIQYYSPESHFVAKFVQSMHEENEMFFTPYVRAVQMGDILFPETALIFTKKKTKFQHYSGESAQDFLKIMKNQAKFTQLALNTYEIKNLENDYIEDDDLEMTFSEIFTSSIKRYAELTGYRFLKGEQKLSLVSLNGAPASYPDCTVFVYINSKKCDSVAGKKLLKLVYNVVILEPKEEASFSLSSEF
ncbi:MAG: class I SAM-dependent methyltransferase [Myxococcaceae bacterium]